jgi:glycosyltransferase involved in cell wall biosynthesis
MPILSGDAMRKRVLFLTSVFDKVDNGPGIYANYLWDAFKNDPDIEFHMVVPSAADKADNLHSSGLQKSSLALYEGVQAKARIVLNKIGKAIIHANNPHLIYNLLDTGCPTFVQVNDYQAADLYRNWIQIIKGHGPRRFAALYWRRNKEKKVFAGADKFLFNSNSTFDINATEYNIDPAKGSVLYKAVDYRTFLKPAVLPADPYPNRPPDARMVFIGSDWQMKGLDILIDALLKLESQRKDFSLVVVGSDKFSANKRIRADVGKSRIADKVIFAGRRSSQEIANLLWHSGFFILPSRQEAFGVAVVEALASGVVVMAAKVGGIPEIISHGVNGILIGRQDSDFLCQEISKILSADTKKQMAENGVKRAMDFDKSVMIKKLRDLYMSQSV